MLPDYTVRILLDQTDNVFRQTLRPLENCCIFCSRLNGLVDPHTYACCCHVSYSTEYFNLVSRISALAVMNELLFCALSVFADWQMASLEYYLQKVNCL